MRKAAGHGQQYAELIEGLPLKIFPICKHKRQISYLTCEIITMFNVCGGVALRYTIYIDILFCVNFIVDYMILVSVQHFRGLNTQKKRLLAGAFIGGLGSLVILLPPVPVYLSWVVNVLETLAMAAAAFLPMGFGRFIKTAICMFVISFFYCGAMTAILALFSPENLVVRNSTVYIGISPLMLICLTLGIYILMRVILRIWGKLSPPAVCEVEICHKGKTLFLKGTVDTGNTLHEVFSGECVIVGRADIFKDMVNVENCTDSMEAVKNGIRFVPFRSVGGSGLMPSFKPSRIYIMNSSRKTEIQAYIGLCGSENLTEENDLLVPSELIMKGS